MKINYYTEGGVRSRALGDAVYDGAKTVGYECKLIDKEKYKGVRSSAAAFYGLWGNSREIMRQYVDAGKKVIFFDLGYWGRVDGGRLNGYHRIAIDHNHANFDIDHRCSPDRFKKFRIDTKKFDHKGEYILLCGQSEKAAWVYNMKPEEWEIKTIEEIRKHTDRPIYYLPKNSWKDKKPIPGTEYCTGDFNEYLTNCWAVVTHHSNSGVHALSQGKPVFTDDGISKVLVGDMDLSRIEHPTYITEDERDIFLFNVAYWQWSVGEIRSGIMFEVLKERGLL